MSDPVRKGRPEAAAAIWDWRRPDDGGARTRAARRMALVRFVIAAAIGAAFFWLDRPAMSALAFAAGGVPLILAIASPLGAYAALDRAIARAGSMVGAVLTFVLLAPVFYLFFVPFGLLFRRGSRDPLRRRFDREAPTYWKRRADDGPDLERPF